MKDSILFQELTHKKSFRILFFLVIFILLLGVYAPFFASPYPFIVYCDEQYYFPFFRFIFCSQLYTKPIDLFFNGLMLTLPIAGILWKVVKNKRKVLFLFFLLQGLLFYSAPIIANSKNLQEYAQLNIATKTNGHFSLRAPISYHWEQNALLGGQEAKNLRMNGQHLYATLLFGIRYSFTVAILACSFAFIWGTLFGALMGYFSGKLDFFFSRVLEVWESLPSLILLLLLISFFEEVNFLFVSFIIALFSWVPIARLVRLEMIKQKGRAYIDVLRNLRVSQLKIVGRHLLPNCYWMLLSIFPQSLVGAITYESALSFLGLGDRHSCSLGILLDEARVMYPMESRLFWPPALVLIALLSALTALGDLIRNTLDTQLNENPF